MFFLSLELSNEWWNTIFSFLAGASTVAFLWLWQQFQDFDTLADDNDTWIDPWNVDWATWGKHYLHRIGELPSRGNRRRHWPWETIRVFGSSSVVDSTEYDEKHAEEDDLTTASTEDTPATSPDQKQTCIGSIFGLDVGGTLSKLVYFEQKPRDYDPLASPRERHYAMAASAQAVALAATTTAGRTTLYEQYTSSTTIHITRITGKITSFGKGTTTKRARNSKEWDRPTTFRKESVGFTDT